MLIYLMNSDQVIQSRRVAGVAELNRLNAEAVVSDNRLWWATAEEACASDAEEQDYLDTIYYFLADTGRL